MTGSGPKKILARLATTDPATYTAWDARAAQVQVPEQQRRVRPVGITEARTRVEHLVTDEPVAAPVYLVNAPTPATQCAAAGAAGQCRRGGGR